MFNKIKQALQKSSSKISTGIDYIFFKKKLDHQTLEDLEDLLIESDIGAKVAGDLTDSLKKIKFDKEVESAEIKEQLAALITKSLEVNDAEFRLASGALNVILVCGVNGNGKTTTIGKLAANYINQGKKVAIAACDTFRAAAVEQIQVWAERCGAQIFIGTENSDPASVAYKAMQQAAADGTDILFIDTAGRLHNYKNLMAELEKITNVITKFDPSAPRYRMLVIDATTGQNAYNQVEEFVKSVNINSIAITKLDGTAKAGVIVGITQKYRVPVHFIGIGERVEDLQEFKPKEFAKHLVGL